MSGDKEDKPRRLIIGVTGATGSIFAVRMLEALRKTDVESHLVLSRWGARTLLHETDYTLDQVRSLATHWYKDNDQGARISSGSFVTLGMVIVPCSVKTLADIAHGHSNELVHRAADVVLKERRRLVLAVREAPFTDIHLENMLKLSRMGVVISPPMPAFYTRPRSINDIVDHTVARLLDLFGIELKGAQRWTGEMGTGAPTPPLDLSSLRVGPRATPVTVERNPDPSLRAGHRLAIGEAISRGIASVHTKTTVPRDDGKGAEMRRKRTGFSAGARSLGVATKQPPPTTKKARK